MMLPIPPSPQQIDDLFVNVPAPAKYTYEFALVLGGTVSAGAYTAGVVDFLIEALDEWTVRRDANPADPTVPPHKAILKLVTGTSGGGVNSATLARALAFDFPHVTAATVF
jgi:predicted acylesterase/phospholipase RssA